MKKNKIIIFIIIIFFLINGSKLYSNINNSVIVSVGNIPITQLDLLKEIKLIAILSKVKIEESNKEQLKNIAIKTLIKRKIKEIEINKYNILNYNTVDLKKLIARTASNIGTDRQGLKKIIEQNNMNFTTLKNKFEIDLKWNTLIFELYKNKVALNMSEIEGKIKSEVTVTEAKVNFLLSEIEINFLKETYKKDIDKVLSNIKKEGFESTAKKLSISNSAEYGGSIGWIDQKNLSKKIRDNIKDLKIDEVSDPIFTDNSIIFIKKNGEKIYEKNIEEIKNRIVRAEKEKKLQMFSKAHFSKLERTTQINFL